MVDKTHLFTAEESVIRLSAKPPVGLKNLSPPTDCHFNLSLRLLEVP